jgi:hypothetical protein
VELANGVVPSAPKPDGALGRQWAMGEQGGRDIETERLGILEARLRVGAWACRASRLFERGRAAKVKFFLF